MSYYVMKMQVYVSDDNHVMICDDARGPKWLPNLCCDESFVLNQVCYDMMHDARIYTMYGAPSPCILAERNAQGPFVKG